MSDDARARAARVLARVWQDASYAAAALDTELSRPPALEPREAALATELTYGVLRTQGYLEARVAELARRGRGIDDALAQAHLLIGLYTLLFLERIPAFAAVSEAVGAISGRLGERPAGFANHVLRSAQKEVERAGRPTLEEAAVRGAPGWLRGALRRSLGRAGASDFLCASARPAPLCLAVRDPSERDAWVERISGAAPSDASVRAGSWSPHAILAERAGDPRRLPGWEEAWIVQEEGAQVLALSLGVQPGDAVLDACAGRGNKTWLLHHLAGPRGRVVALDKHPAKLERLSARLAAREGSAGGRGVETAAVDLTLGTGDVEGSFDRVLVDAPCSGVGTLRRRPEIALHRSADSLRELASAQAQITLNAARLGRDGARLVYAVCSVLSEECEQVVEALCSADAPDVALEPAPFEAQRLPCEAGATSMRLMPNVHGTDGFFAASFVVRRR